MAGLSRPALLLRDLPANCCRWPLHDLADPQFAWCGQVTAGPPYCTEHHRASLQKHEVLVPLTAQERAELFAWWRRAAGGGLAR